MEEKLEVQQKTRRSLDVRAQRREKLRGQIKQLKQLKLRGVEPKHRMELFRKINEEFKLYIQMCQQRQKAPEQLPKETSSKTDDSNFPAENLSSAKESQSLCQTVNSMQPQSMKSIGQQEHEKDKYKASEEKLELQPATKRPLDNVETQRNQDLRHQVEKLKQLKLRRTQVKQKIERLKENHEDYMLSKEILMLNLEMAENTSERRGQLRKDQEMKYSVTSHVVYQPGGQVPGMPPQSTFTTAMGQPSQPPPNYQSVTLTTKLYPPGTQRQGKSPCQSGFAFHERNKSGALKAPDWVDGYFCHSCCVRFGIFTRQHHCRCCGQVFCNKCSSKNSTIPKFGIEQKVRVCDPCYNQLHPDQARSPLRRKTSSKANDSNLPQPKHSQVPEKKSDEEIKRQEPEDLQLAMALSVSEQETKQSLCQTVSSMQPQSMKSIEQQEHEKDKHETIFEKRLEVLQKTKRSLDDAVRSQTLDIIRQLKLKREMSCGMQIEQKMQSPGQQKQENTLYEQRLQTQPQQAMEQIPKESLPQQGPLQFQPTTDSPPQYDNPRQHGQHPKQSPPEQALLPSQHFQTQQPPPTQQGQPSQHGQLPQHGQPSQQFLAEQALVPSQQFQTQQPPPTSHSQPPHISQQQYPSSHGPQPHPTPQTQGPPLQENIPAQGPPLQNYQPPQYGQGPPSQPPPQPPGPPSMQYQNQPADPRYEQNSGQQQWGQVPGGNYQQPPPPSYGGYEQTQQPYGQRQCYEQNAAEAQLISFD